MRHRPATTKLPSTAYFDHYTVLQRYKHDLLRYYLGGWFSKIASLGRGAMYCETHAGAGVHGGGQKGSPIVAIQTLLTHRLQETILAKSRLGFLFMEIDRDNVAALEKEREQLSLPPGVNVRIEAGDFKEVLARQLDLLESKTGIPPAFTFVDPFGYDLPLRLIHRLLNAPNGEVLITFMTQPVARAAGDPTKAENLDTLYGGGRWGTLAATDEFERRKQVALALYESAVGARWCTALRLTGQTDYALLHFTNHPEGRDLMKKAIWAIEPTGHYQVFRADNPDQLTLIEPEPDLAPLIRRLRTELSGAARTYDDLVSWVRDTDYRSTHLNKVLSQGRRTGWVSTEHARRFGPSCRLPIVIQEP